MTTFHHGLSKADGARNNRASSLARDIAKRHEKPFRTERKRILTRKKRLNVQTSHTNPEDGYTFLPVGTPDLAERCKEISRQKGFEVKVVNARPVHRDNANPHKVSYHTHRIGYHFRTEVLDQACEELDYTFHRGQFIRFEDLQQQHHNSAIAAVLARYGVEYDPNNKPESPEHVRAAIKELFPKIPDNDLYEIVRHAWQEGTDRVGTNQRLVLSRRVQLAVGARIRHAYTDYDTLLKAFDWRTARDMVGPVTLRKLIEWRGEDGADNDDEELEEIVRETIVIEDDSNDDSDSGTDFGEITDTSNEFMHDVVADDNFAAEASDERALAYHGRLPPPPNVKQQKALVRRKIIDARLELRNAPAQPPRNLRASAGPAPPAPPASNVFQICALPTAEEIVLDGQLYRKMPTQPVHPKHSNYTRPTVVSNYAIGQPLPAHHATQKRYSAVQASTNSNGAAAHNGAVPSIEYNLDQSNLISVPSGQFNSTGNLERLHYHTTDSDRAEKRRRVESGSYNDANHKGKFHAPRLPPHVATSTSLYHDAGSELPAVIDLTSPRRSQQARPIESHPPVYLQREDVIISNREPLPQRSVQYAQVTLPPPSYMPAAADSLGSHVQEILPRASAQQPLPPLPAQTYAVEKRFQPSLPNYSQHPDFHGPRSTQTQSHQYQTDQAEWASNPPAPMSRVVLDQDHYFLQRKLQPVHGEPAPVQQVPREPPRVLQSASGTAHPGTYYANQIPTNGAVAPAQYYVQR